MKNGDRDEAWPEFLKSEKQKIGFFGAYSYDIILYFARTLSLAGKQVLIIDRSIEQEVIRMIRPMHAGDLQLGIFRFCGIDITSRSLFPEGMNAEDIYDVILFDFGTNMCPDEYCSCDVICYVLDMYVHNALAVQKAEELPDARNWMILRDLLRGKALARYHMRLTGKMVKKEDIYYIRLNSDDFVARFRMEADQLPRVELASEEMQKVVQSLVEQIHPEASLKKGSRGRNKKNSAEKESA